MRIYQRFNNADTVFEFAVDGGHRAVIFDRFAGIKQDVTGEGTHFYIPWVQRPITFDIRSRPRNIPVITGSKGYKSFYYNIPTNISTPLSASVFRTFLEKQ